MHDMNLTLSRQAAEFKATRKRVSDGADMAERRLEDIKAIEFNLKAVEDTLIHENAALKTSISDSISQIRDLVAGMYTKF